jgi:5-methylcytosine-specific restriction endonuclease McrA
MSTSVATALALLRADPHKWGQGHVHQIDTASDRTMCGKTPASCPGTRFDGVASEITCQACRRVIENREQRALEAEQRAVESDQWWYLYDEYLGSEIWQHKRALVMKRAGGLCEGCGVHRALQVHHTRYPWRCQPGTREWIAQEKLFDLRAVCRECHDDLHPQGAA